MAYGDKNHFLSKSQVTVLQKWEEVELYKHEICNFVLPNLL